MCVHNYGKIARIQLKKIEFLNTLMDIHSSMYHVSDLMQVS